MKACKSRFAIRTLLVGLVTSLEFLVFRANSTNSQFPEYFFTISSEIKAELRVIARLFSHISSELHSKPELSFKSLFLGEELSLISSTVQLQLATKLFAKFAFMCLRLQNTTEKNIFCELLKASLLLHKPKPNDTTTIAMYWDPKLDSLIFRFRIQQASFFFFLLTPQPLCVCAVRSRVEAHNRALRWARQANISRHDGARRRRENEKHFQNKAQVAARSCWCC